MQGVFEEGFISKAEYETRRKALIDGATTVTVAEQPAVAAPELGKKSVFERIGAAGAQPSNDSWGHDGYEELYGREVVTNHNVGGKAGVTKTIVKKTTTKASGKLTLNARFEPYQPPHQRLEQTDLRSRIGKGATKRIGKGGVMSKSLPEKCPW